MTFRTTATSPSHKSASDGTAGRKVQGTGNLLVNTHAPRIPSPQEKQVVADQMRYQLYLLDRSAQRMSIEDCVAALLERSGTELSS